MMTHNMHLVESAFRMIASETKTIEIRLNDEKRQAVKAGDVIVFSLAGHDDEKITTEVVEIFVSPKFKKLFSQFFPEELGGSSQQELLESIYKIYSPEEEKRFGVVGIKVKKT